MAARMTGVGDEPAGSLIGVRVELTVVSAAEGRTGTETMSTRMRLPAVPRAADWIELAPGWSAGSVAAVIFSDRREPLIRLQQVKTDDPERLDEYQQLIQAHGWKCPGWRLGII
jgi:hypothetical protein